MIELIQFPWSPFCLVQRRILEFSGAPFKITNIPNQDRSLIWKLTKQRYYGVPILRDGRKIVFESGDDSQKVAEYLDKKLKLGLFLPEWQGIQSILWRVIENDVEGAGFRLNDIHWREIVPAKDQLIFLRFKERKFGRGCIEQWRTDQKNWLKKLEEVLAPFEQMLSSRAFLLDARPRFVDFDLFGILENFLYSGHYELPKRHQNIRQWHRRMRSVTLKHIS